MTAPDAAAARGAAAAGGDADEATVAAIAATATPVKRGSRARRGHAARSPLALAKSATLASESTHSGGASAGSAGEATARLAEAPSGAAEPPAAAPKATRRSLADQLDEGGASPQASTPSPPSPEVFNMAAGEALRDGPGGSPARAASGGVLEEDEDSEDFESGLRRSGRPRRLEEAAGGEEVDAWSLEHWDSPTSILQDSTMLSPCSSARTLDEPLRQVADAVRAELQIDLETMVHRAVSQMSSWISEEIAFARGGLSERLEKDAEEAAEKGEGLEDRVARLQAAEEERGTETKRLEAELAERAAKTEAMLDEIRAEQLRLLKVVTEPGAGCPSASVGGAAVASVGGSAGTASAPRSFSVEEARQMAEERRWRLKFDDLQEKLDTSAQAIQALERKADEQSIRTSRQEGELRQATAAIQKAAERASKAESVAAAAAEGLRVDADASQARAEALAARLEAAEGDLGGRAEALAEGLEAAERGLGARAEALAERLGAVERGLADAEGGAKRAEATVLAAERERLAELRVVCGKLEAQGQALETLREELPARLEERVSKPALDEALAARDSRVSEVQRQLSDLLDGEERLADRMAQLKELAEALDARDARFDGLRAEIAQGLQSRATGEELREVTDRLSHWLDEARRGIVDWQQQANSAMAAEIDKALSQSAEHGVALLRHTRSLDHISDWVEQVRVREQGLTQVILHVVEKGSPELMKLFENALSVPKFEARKQ